MRIGVIGIAGRMGQLLVEEALAAGHVVSGGLLRPGEAAPAGAPVLTDLAALAAASDAVVDFTIASAAAGHAKVLAGSGAAWILGTSGLSAADEAAVAQAATSIPVVYSGNFSVGITLLLELAARMGAALPAERYDVEIIEMHHRQKVDAPSGTATALGRAVAASRGVDLADVKDSGRDGLTGPRCTGAIGFSAIRGGQVVGEHKLLFAGATEHLSLTHQIFDRRVFASGAILAAGWTQDRPPGLYDMRDVTGC